jgi:hypothetical protein
MTFERTSEKRSRPGNLNPESNPNVRLIFRGIELRQCTSLLRTTPQLIAEPLALELGVDLVVGGEAANVDS